MAKLDIDFVLLDETTVRFGFRALMDGAELEDFKANPVMLLQHNRPSEWKGKDEIMLPIGRWWDIRVEDRKLLAKPDFDDDDDMAMKVQKKVEKKYLNGASVWIDPIASSDEDHLKAPGQYLPTVTRWGILEASIVDIPNCRNALALRNSDGARIELSAHTNKTDIKTILQNISIDKKETMDKKLLAVKLGLAEDATDVQISEKLQAVLTAGSNITQLTTENQALKDQIVQLKDAAVAAQINNLVDGAVNEGKLTAEDAPTYKKLAAADFETTQAAISKMKPYESVESKLSTAKETDKAELDALTKLSGIDLYKTGQLEKLRKLSEPHFKTKYKEAFGVEFKG